MPNDEWPAHLAHGHRVRWRGSCLESAQLVLELFTESCAEPPAHDRTIKISWRVEAGGKAAAPMHPMSFKRFELPAWTVSCSVTCSDQKRMHHLDICCTGLRSSSLVCSLEPVVGSAHTAHGAVTPLVSRASMQSANHLKQGVLLSEGHLAWIGSCLSPVSAASKQPGGQ